MKDKVFRGLALMLAAYMIIGAAFILFTQTLSGEVVPGLLVMIALGVILYRYGVRPKAVLNESSEQSE